MREAQYLAGQSRQAASAQPATPDISALFRILSSQQQAQQAPAPQPQPAPPAASTGLEQIFAQFASANNQQQTQPPQLQQPTLGFDLQAALANMSQPNQYGAPQAAPVPNLTSILAGLNGQQPTAQAPQMLGYGFGGQYVNENDRKRQYEQDEGEYGFGKGKRSRQGGGQGKKPVSLVNSDIPSARYSRFTSITVHLAFRVNSFKKANVERGMSVPFYMNDNVT